MQRSVPLVQQFTRRVAFGLPHQAALPDDPLAWAKAQLKGESEQMAHRLAHHDGSGGRPVGLELHGPFREQHHHG